MEILGQLLCPLLLNILIVTQGGGKPLSRSPLHSTLHLRRNRTTKDLDDMELKYDAIFNKPLTADESKTPNIKIKDNHDHKPRFLQNSYRTSIPETSQINTTILKVEAKDKHTYLIKYSLSGPFNDYFHMNSSNGVITLAKVLEYNRINRYNLNASAENPWGFSSTVPVHIDIQDVDTMDPHFIYPLYEGSISENQRGDVSTHPEAIKAIDGDLGINENLYYSISKVYPPEYRNFTSIDSSSGKISLNKELDREIVSLLTAEIKATQQNDHLKSADSVVMVTILDENDNAPQFSQSTYEVFVPENSSPGIQILVLPASDKDKDGLSNGYFRTNNTMFNVDKSGVMYLSNGVLDREFTPIILLQVWVFDAPDGLNSSAEVIIHITDVNDNNPEFHNLPLHYTIPEGDYTDNSPILVATITVTDLDTGLNGNVTVTEDAENGDGSFQVQENGKIFVQGPLDREVKDKYVLFLVAADKGNPPRKSFAEAVIDIQDVNDNTPTFTKEEYSADLILNKVKAGDTILSVSATDLDVGDNALISYRFGKPHSGFIINEENGDIYLTSDVFSVNMGTDIVITVVATDHGSPALSSTATVIIKVSEVPTEFVNSNFSFSLPEGMPEGSDVGSLEVTVGPHVSVMYSIQTYSTVFSITDKGTIITRITLDREIQDTYDILVEAVDSQDPPYTAVTTVIVTVMDINDNFPVFSPFINSNVKCLENMNLQNLANITATDRDIGDNGAITYSLENDYGSTFLINSSTGKLMNIKPLDAEKTDSYNLKVIAHDSGIPPLSSTAMIHVTVLDVDDNSPIFKKNLYNVTIKENEPPHLILNVSAVDMDREPDAVILYSLINGSGLFYIGEESGSIFSLKPLDFETRTEYVLTATAYGPKNHHPQSAATIIVHIEDVNEEGPAVEHTVYHTVIWDGEYATGSMILDINAKKGNNNMDDGIHYSMSGDNRENLFSIANGTGHVFLTKDLPMHSSPEYFVFTVTCTDSGAPPQSTSIKVYVVLSSSHILVPVFSADYYEPASLNTWTAPHSYLIRIKAFYLNSSPIYSITEEKYKDYFTVDPLSGVIRTKKHLNMEDFPMNVTVKATDPKQSGIYSEATVHVTVINRNRYAPVFTKVLQNVRVKEEQPVPTFIAQVQAEDEDLGRNGILTYSILSNHSHPFTIDATNGTLFTNVPFDYETGPHEFQVVICAEDDGRPDKKQGYLSLIVQVVDINDHAPVFSPHGFIYVKESAPAGTVVGQLTATDEDNGDNAFVVYSLFDDDDQFGIERQRGNIFIKRQLDHEVKRRSILNVTASNNKTAPYYQTRTNLTVYILDENDNAPQFTQKTYFAKLDVNSPAGSPVITVNATDRDEGDNGVVEYSLLPDSSSSFFIFKNITDGRLITATNHLKPGKFTLTVIAKDRGSPSLSDMASVIVDLLNSNKKLPEFSPNELSTVLKENNPKEEPVYTFSAKKPSGKDVTYRIVAGNEGGQFYLDEKTGKLWTTEKFKVDGKPSYDITVEADTPPETQGPLPPNMAELHITVPNFQEGPMFKEKLYTTTIVNNLPPGFPVIKVTATSKGSMPLIYSLMNQPGEEFHIDKYTGQISVSQVAGKTGTFRFKAKVTDSNGLFDETTVQVQVVSLPSSDDVEEFKINQTSDEVKQQIPKITRILEDALQKKVTIISADSDASNKKDTDITFKAEGESKQDIARKLKDKTLTIQKQLSSIFGKPIDVTIPQPNNLPLSPTAIGVIGGFVAILLVGIISAAFLILRDKTAKNDSKKDGGTELPSETNNKNEGSKDIENDENKRDDTPNTGAIIKEDSAPGTLSEIGTHEQIGSDNIKRDEAPNIKAAQDDGSEYGSRSNNDQFQDVDIEIKRTKAADESPDQQTEETGGVTQGETEEDIVVKRTKAADESPDQQTEETGGGTQGETEEDIVVKRTKAADESPAQQTEETGRVTQGETEEDIIVKRTKAAEESPDQQTEETGGGTQGETEEDIVVKRTKAADESPDQQMEETVTVIEEETEEDIVVKRTKAADESPDQQTEETVTVIEEETEEDIVVKRTKAADESPDQQTEETGRVTQGETEEDIVVKRTKAAEESPDQQTEETGGGTQGETEEDIVVKRTKAADQSPDQQMEETVTVIEEETEEDIVVKRTKAADESPDQQTEETVTVIEEETEEDIVVKRTKAADESPAQQTEETVTVTKEETEEDIVVKRTKAADESPDQQMEETVTVIEEETEEDIVVKRTKAADESPDQQTEETVTVIEEETEEDIVVKRTKAADETPDQQTEETVTVIEEETEEDIVVKRTKAADESPDQQTDEPVTVTWEENEEDIIVKRTKAADEPVIMTCESEPGIQKASEEAAEKTEELPTITERKEVEYVESWESYESSEDSDMEVPKTDEVNKETLKPPDSSVIQP
ncbi:protocadherin Fat 4-like isoform X3 [Engystomops pustulosus]|uniref:protocadherin Fat 4-like isoform X3 n=1 Tax=Engystomops pustulosus TaxID=76066 RepID=UPI003AFA25B3